MNRIDSIIEELNELCRDYIKQQDRFRDFEKIRELFREMKTLGFTIVTPLFEVSSPESQFLSENGKNDLQQMSDIQKKKLQAIKNNEFERAADLRDLERQLLGKIRLDFSQITRDRFFIIPSGDTNLIIFNDPERLLMNLFR